MMHPVDVLKRYWGHQSFRPLQEDIINSVLSSKDTIALLPTGGGKSVCFQLPAMIFEGLCIVVSPLIALMNDQVDHLKQQGMKAVAIHSALSRKEIDIQLDNCVYGKIKFLYVSPERLKTEIFIERVKKMNVRLLAVDEAHCISEWGYDFRPAYLEIAKLRKLLPGIPVIALTASATPEVVDDIGKRLLMKNSNIFRKSFKRENLSYIIYNEENKRKKLLHILSRVGATSIIYVRSRKFAEETASFLEDSGIKATYYHGGLDYSQRNQRQEMWMQNKKQSIVCTNAFGMGIDKPDVRLVVHIDLPETLEAYYQEAGRAGRDGKKSYAVVLFSGTDVNNLERRFSYKYPSKDFVKSVYDALGNYFQLAIGSGRDSVFPLDLNNFLFQYNLHPQKTFNALRIIEQLGWIQWVEAGFMPSRLMMRVGKDAVYKLQVENHKLAPVIQFILRAFGGVFEQFVTINELSMASKMEIDVESVEDQLELLNKLEIIYYEKKSGIPKIIYLRSRVMAKEMFFRSNIYEQRHSIDLKKMKSVQGFVYNSKTCRSAYISSYFGEDTSIEDCGVCDICISKRKSKRKSSQKILLVRNIQDLLQYERKSVDEIILHFRSEGEDNVIEAIRWMMEQGMISKNEENILALIS